MESTLCYNKQQMLNLRHLQDDYKIQLLDDSVSMKVIPTKSSNDSSALSPVCSGLWYLEKYLSAKTLEISIFKEDICELYRNGQKVKSDDVFCKHYAFLLEQCIANGLGTQMQDVFIAYNQALFAYPKSRFANEMENKAFNIVFSVFNELKSYSPKFWRLCCVCGSLLAELFAANLQFHRLQRNKPERGLAPPLGPLITQLTKFPLIICSKIGAAKSAVDAKFLCQCLIAMCTPFLLNQKCSYLSLVGEINWRCRMLALHHPKLNYVSRSMLLQLSAECIQSSLNKNEKFVQPQPGSEMLPRQQKLEIKQGKEVKPLADLNTKSFAQALKLQNLKLYD